MDSIINVMEGSIVKNKTVVNELINSIATALFLTSNNLMLLYTYSAIYNL